MYYLWIYLQVDGINVTIVDDYLHMYIFVFSD